VAAPWVSEDVRVVGEEAVQETPARADMNVAGTSRAHEARPLHAMVSTPKRHPQTREIPQDGAECLEKARAEDNVETTQWDGI
jgi:hypothetical protein